MALKKLFLEHVLNTWTSQNNDPAVNDWQGNALRYINVVRDTDLLVACHFQEEDENGSIADFDMSDAQAVRVYIRQERNPSSYILASGNSYNQGYYAPAEDLTGGKVTWLINVGSISFPTWDIDPATDTIWIDGRFADRFNVGDDLTFSDTDTNLDSGVFQISFVQNIDDSTSGAAGLEGRTEIQLEQSIDADSSAAPTEGYLQHSTLQHLDFGADGKLDAYLEVVWVNNDGQEQTLLPMRSITIWNTLNYDVGGVSSGLVGGYLTSEEIANTYLNQETADVTYLNENENLADVESAPTAFNNIKQSATTTNAGVSEIATQTEADGGTDDQRHLTPAKAPGNIRNNVKLDDLQPAEDNTDLDATASKHGLMPKSDKSKLNNIESNADVTDADNVGSAINSQSADSTPADDDQFAQTSSTGSLAYTAWSTIKSLIASYIKSNATGFGQLNFDQEYNNGTVTSNTTIDWANGINQVVTIDADVTLSFANIGVGTKKLRVVQGSSGGVPTLPSGKWPGSSAGSFSTSSGAEDILSIYDNGTSYYYQLTNDWS